MAKNIGVRPSTTTGSLNVKVDPVIEDEILTHYPVNKLAIGADGEATLISESSPVPVAQQMTFKTDAVTVLNEISLKLSKLLEYQALLHEIDLGE